MSVVPGQRRLARSWRCDTGRCRTANIATWAWPRTRTARRTVSWAGHRRPCSWWKDWWPSAFAQRMWPRSTPARYRPVPPWTQPCTLDRRPFGTLSSPVVRRFRRDTTGPRWLLCSMRRRCRYHLTRSWHGCQHTDPRRPVLPIYSVPETQTVPPPQCNNRICNTVTAV